MTIPAHLLDTLSHYTVNTALREGGPLAPRFYDEIVLHYHLRTEQRSAFAAFFFGPTRTVTPPVQRLRFYYSENGFKHHEDPMFKQTCRDLDAFFSARDKLGG